MPLSSQPAVFSIATPCNGVDVGPESVLAMEAHAVDVAETQKGNSRQHGDTPMLDRICLSRPARTRGDPGQFELEQVLDEALNAASLSIQETD